MFSNTIHLFVLGFLQVQEEKHAALRWFVDVRGSLKGRLPIQIFRAKCIKLYNQWLHNEEEEIKENRLVFSSHWIKDWMKEYNINEPLTRQINEAVRIHSNPNSMNRKGEWRIPATSQAQFVRE